MPLIALWNDIARHHTHPGLSTIHSFLLQHICLYKLHLLKEFGMQCEPTELWMNNFAVTFVGILIALHGFIWSQMCNYFGCHHLTGSAVHIAFIFIVTVRVKYSIGWGMTRRRSMQMTLLQLDTLTLTSNRSWSDSMEWTFRHPLWLDVALQQLSAVLWWMK